MRVFVINLENSTERKKFMKHQLDALGLDHEFFPAVDGRKLSGEDMKQMCDLEVVKAWADLLTPGMIGCSLSHYHVYKKMIEENIDLALILEDDTRLSSQVPFLISEVEDKINNGVLSRNEPILLYYQSKEVVSFTASEKVDLTNNIGVYYPIDIWRPITTAAYIISLPCARRLVKLIYPVRYSPDSWAVYHREDAIAGLRCVLPLQVESGLFKSDIGYEQDKLLNRIVKKLEAKNVPAVRLLLSWRRRKLAKQQNQFVFMQMPRSWQKKELV